MNLSEEDVRTLTDSFTVIKAKYESLEKVVQKQQTDADQFAATMRERVSALGDGRGVTETLGSRFVNSPQFKAWREAKQPGHMRWERPEGVPVDLKTITNATVQVPAQFGGMIPFVHAPLAMRQILPIVPVTVNSVEYRRAVAKVVTGSIVQVAEGDLKASATWDYEPVTANIATMAETTKVSLQCLEDVPQLQSAIDEELRAQVRAMEELQILTGTGAAGHMEGFLDVAPVFSGAVVGDKPVDIVQRAIGQLQGAGYAVSAVVLGPAAWTAMGLMRDTTGRPLYPNVTTLPWNAQVVVSSAMPADTFLVGAFRTFSALLDRSESLQVGTSEDDFVRNLVTVRYDLRSGLIIKRPTAFLKGSLTAPIS